METLLVGLYTWRAVWNGVQLIIIFAVFDRLNVRFEIVVVAILGLIYVTIRTIAFGNWQMLVGIALPSPALGEPARGLFISTESLR